LHLNNIYANIYIYVNTKTFIMPENIYKLEIFRWIDHDVIEHIVLNCETRNYTVEKVIMHEWDSSNWEWYIIKNGKISISIKGSKIAELSAWDIFWEIALLNEEERTATVTALSDLEVIVLSLDNLIEMINNDENKINKTIMNRIEENINR